MFFGIHFGPNKSNTGNEEKALVVDDLEISIVRKRVRHLYLRIRRSDGRVTVTAPLQLSLAEIRAFVLTKRGWVRRHKARLCQAGHQQSAPSVPSQSREHRFVDGEQFFVWGKAFALEVIERPGRSEVFLDEPRLVLKIRPNAERRHRQAAIHDWYRQQLLEALSPMIAIWAPRLGVRVDHYHVRMMKTRWGSCTPARRSIRLNVELAKRRRDLLEYVLVHELAHLIEANHGPRFYALMNTHWPRWRESRAELNSGLDRSVIDSPKQAADSLAFANDSTFN